MFGPAAAYVVAISTLLFCGLCAVTLIRTIDHFDPPEGREAPEQAHEKATV